MHSRILTPILLVALAACGADPSETAVAQDARDLYADATCATPGTAVAYDEGADLDNSSLWAAPGAGPTHDPAVWRARLAADHLPYRKTPGACTPVAPHSFLRVNTIFEVAH